MRKILLRITLFLFSFFVISFFLYNIFRPIFSAQSITFSFAITPFDIAKVYPKIWDSIKKSYFPLFFISYTIIFNYLYTVFKKYFIFKNSTKTRKLPENPIEKNSLQLLIGKNLKRRKNLLRRIWPLSKHAYYWNYW